MCGGDGGGGDVYKDNIDRFIQCDRLGPHNVCGGIRVMDFIIRDLFDIVEKDDATLHSIWAQVVPLPPAEQSPDIRAILTHPRMLDCLAFHDMWIRGGLGGSPSRVLFTIFHRAIRSDRRTLNEALTVVFSQSLHLIDKTRGHVLEEHKKMYELARASFAASDVRCAFALLEKVVRRHVLLTRRDAVLKAPANGISLVDRLVQVYRNEAPATLAAFEAWCMNHPDTPYISAANLATDIRDYAARTRAVVGALQLGVLDPVTDMYTGDVLDNVGWSCIEALAHGINVNGYLWRADSRGAVYVSPPDDSGTDMIGRALNRIFVRHTRMPWRIFLSVCPTSLYDRVIIRIHTKEDAAEVQDAGKVLKSEAALHSGSLRLEIVPLGITTLVQGPRIHCVDFSSANKYELSLVSSSGDRLVMVDWRDGHDTPAPALVHSLQTELLSRYTTCRFAKDGAPPSGIESMHDFVVRYAHIRGLLNGGLRVRHQALSNNTRQASASPPLGCVVTVDNRPNVWSMLAVLVSLDNLDASRWPTIVIVCAPDNARFVERSLSSELLPECTRVVVHPLEELSRFPLEPGCKDFSIERYSLLLKQKRFWEGVHEKVSSTGASPPTYALMVQDDGMLVRPGLEAQIDAHGEPIAYLGAPWAETPSNDELRQRVGGLVGNGGLSLRNMSAMIQLSEGDTISPGALRQRLFAHNAIPEPEDVYFSRKISSDESSWKAVSTSEATKFAFEQCSPAPDTLGFHKPWGYLPHETVARFFSSAIEEAAARSVIE